MVTCVFMLSSQYQKAIDKIMGNSSSSSLPALQTVASCDTSRFMGTWFVIAVKPTVFETKSSNCVEKYTFLDSGKTSHDIDIDFTYNEEAPLTSKIKALPQKGYVQGDKYNSAVWKVSPMWPIKLDYSVIELGNNYEYCVIGYPNRNYCWIMGRHPVMAESTFKSLTKKLVEKHQYPADTNGGVKGLRMVEQKWTRAECEKRGLTTEDVPDDMLSK